MLPTCTSVLENIQEDIYILMEGGLNRADFISPHDSGDNAALYGWLRADRFQFHRYVSGGRGKFKEGFTVELLRGVMLKMRGSIYKIEGDVTNSDNAVENLAPPNAEREKDNLVTARDLEKYNIDKDHTVRNSGDLDNHVDTIKEEPATANNQIGGTIANMITKMNDLIIQTMLNNQKTATYEIC